MHSDNHQFISVQVYVRCASYLWCVQVDFCVGYMSRLHGNYYPLLNQSEASLVMYYKHVQIECGSDSAKHLWLYESHMLPWLQDHRGNGSSPSLKQTPSSWRKWQFRITASWLVDRSCTPTSAGKHSRTWWRGWRSETCTSPWNPLMKLTCSKPHTS